MTERRPPARAGAEPAGAPHPERYTPEQRSATGRLIRCCLENRFVVALLVLGAVLAGLVVAPFDWKLGGIERRPVPVDAIPDIGENQQIVFTAWEGRSPRDVEDQVTYPLTAALLGVPGVRTVRSHSLFGFSSIYVIFKDDAAFYWSRSRLLERLNSLPAGTLPEGVQPALGPDATALGQVYWYTLEGRDPDGRPAPGWDPEALRAVQDWLVRYRLLAVDGVAEVGSVGGYVREYQVDVDPDALRAHGVTLEEVFAAVKASNLDVGAGPVELNRVEYFVRGVGFVRGVSDIESSVVRTRAGNVPVLVKHVARVTVGPAGRRGALDKGGAPAVGGVVVARYGDNPLAVIRRVKERIGELRAALPAKVWIGEGTPRETAEAYARAAGFEAFEGPAPNQAGWLAHLQATPRARWPAWVNLSRVTVVPFYDRAGLIYETLGTLHDAISLEILVTVLVVLVMVANLRGSLLVSGMLPLTVLLCFVGMKAFGVQANIVALSGIAIAIGTIVDMGIVVTENILRHVDRADPGESTIEVLHRAASEVGGAVLTAVATTVVSFLPVFAMTGAEGKLFGPLAYTKTFALVASVVIALTVLPAAAHLVLCGRLRGRRLRAALYAGVVLAGLAVGVRGPWWMGAILALFGLYPLLRDRVPERFARRAPAAAGALAVWTAGLLLARLWEPLGAARGAVRNAVFVVALVGGLLLFFALFRRVYPRLLRWCLAHKAAFLAAPAALVLLGALAGAGFPRLFGWLPAGLRATPPLRGLAHVFPGLGREFMPPLDEGSFLWMPTTMPHASIGAALDVLETQDRAFESIPEVESVVGKLGRADTPLDPAPVSMFETLITYRPEFVTDEAGRRLRFRYDRARGAFVRDARGALVPDPGGRPYRQWRDSIRSPEDIWKEIVRAGRLPGTTSAPRLQPIAARIVMLQSGLRAPMGVKVFGPSLEAIEAAAVEIERLLKEVPGVEPATVLAERIVGKPYLEIAPDRAALARYGVSVRAFQDVVATAIGGRRATTAVEGRERFAVRVRYARELRDSLEGIERVLVSGRAGQQVPLAQLAEVRYVRGPQAIKSEDALPVGYVVFDKQPGEAEVDVVERCRAYLDARRADGGLRLAAGVGYRFAGNYENQVRASRTLALILPVALLSVFLLIYLPFRSVPVAALVFLGVFVAWAGGFLLLWLYGRPWFLDAAVFGVSLREVFQVHPVNLSVAVWVGFLALFGIATDTGVLQAACIRQVLRRTAPRTRAAVREAVVEAGVRRLRPCLMTTATTALALLPVLTSTGRGSDVMVPMAIPSFGGMLVQAVTMLVVPVLYAALRERGLARAPSGLPHGAPPPSGAGRDAPG